MAEERASRGQTNISQHKRKKKKLVPPMAEIPNMKHTSWLDDRLPEMLWAALVVTVFPREEALRRIMTAVKAARYVSDELSILPKESERDMLVTMSGIASVEAVHQELLVQAMAPDEAGKNALRPLLWLESLPARETWLQVLDRQPLDDDWQRLSEAVLKTLYHQSQEATDCRWARVACGVVTGRIMFMKGTMEAAEDIRLYATYNEEQLQRARAIVRSAEIAFAMKEPSQWAGQFWEECRRRTGCLVRSFDPSHFKAAVPTKEILSKQRKRCHEVNEELTQHFWTTCNSTALDSKHQASFGIALYASDIVTTAVALGMSRTAQGRMTIRTLVECLVNLAYLAAKDDPALWLAFRKHGHGQAKLVCQKAEEEGRQPDYLDMSALGFIANEDVWVEFLEVDIGHWEGSNLRSMAEAVNLKEVYDDYYVWPSAYVHGQWGAVREYVLDLCRNPLHRVHKVPMLTTLTLPDCYDDLNILLDQILDVLYTLYPKPKRKPQSQKPRKKQVGKNKKPD